MKVRVCPNCGKHNPENIVNCNDCGTTLSMKTLVDIEEGGKQNRVGGRSLLTNTSPYFEQDLTDILKTVKTGFEEVVWGNNFTQVAEKPPYNFGFFIITSWRLICVYFTAEINIDLPKRTYLDLGESSRAKSVGANIIWLLFGWLIALIAKRLQHKLAVNYPTTELTQKEKISRTMAVYDLKNLVSKDLLSTWYGDVQLKSVVARFLPKDEVTLTFIDTDMAEKAYALIKTNK